MIDIEHRPLIDESEATLQTSAFDCLGSTQYQSASASPFDGASADVEVRWSAASFRITNGDSETDHAADIVGASLKALNRWSAENPF